MNLSVTKWLLGHTSWFASLFPHQVETLDQFVAAVKKAGCQEVTLLLHATPTIEAEDSFMGINIAYGDAIKYVAQAPGERDIVFEETIFACYSHTGPYIGSVRTLSEIPAIMTSRTQELATLLPGVSVHHEISKECNFLMQPMPPSH